MKKLKQIVAQVKSSAMAPAAELTELLWQLICYPPKMPLRLHQQQLIDEAEKFDFVVNDEYFTHQPLTIRGFKWGQGKTTVLISHGWGSKAADFTEMVTALQQNPDLTILAFDAPACGSSDGELSNLLLFVAGVKGVIEKYGSPDVVIGHSFGAMANVLALQQAGATPKLLISITPFILLQENFIASMTAAEVAPEAQNLFLESFKERYSVPASYYNLNQLYKFDAGLNHWLAYDEHDILLPYSYLHEFLTNNPGIQTTNYNNAGHERIIKLAALIDDVAAHVQQVTAS
ncbi:alpha/beta hydrolase [Inquilinus sp. KBS0705]|nr:alpha/beta hydrolase [Inquilinus sp. KBS0705]